MVCLRFPKGHKVVPSGDFHAVIMGQNSAVGFLGLPAIMKTIKSVLISSLIYQLY